MMDIKINDTAIKAPSACSIQKFSITKSARMLNGTMCMDLVAKKVKLLLVYDVIGGDELKQIEDIVYGSEMFFTVDYNDLNGVAQSKTMYVGDIEYDRFRTEGVWYWRNLKFNLIEQ